MKNLLLFLTLLTLTGCATAVSYSSFTTHKFPPKPSDYFISTYPDDKLPPATQPYTVIGSLSISGYASNGVAPQTVQTQSQAIARKKGADAIIHANTQVIPYSGVYVNPAHVSYHPVVVGGVYGYHHDVVETAYVAHYHPTTYVPYSNELIKFNGDLIVFTPRAVPSPTAANNAPEQPTQPPAAETTTNSAK